MLLTSYQVLVWIVPSIAPQPTEGEERGGGERRTGPLGPARVLAPARRRRIRTVKCYGGRGANIKAR